jgi:hypothetical protein
MSVHPIGSDLLSEYLSPGLRSRISYPTLDDHTKKTARMTEASDLIRTQRPTMLEPRPTAENFGVDSIFAGG